MEPAKDFHGSDYFKANFDLSLMLTKYFLPLTPINIISLNSVQMKRNTHTNLAKSQISGYHEARTSLHQAVMADVVRLRFTPQQEMNVTDTECVCV